MSENDIEFESEWERSAHSAYKVTLWRFGETHRWENDQPADTLEEALELGHDELQGDGKYDVRILDRQGNIVAHLKEAYEDPTIDIIQDDWLEDIQDAYGIPDEAFRRAIERWLKDHS